MKCVTYVRHWYQSMNRGTNLVATTLNLRREGVMLQHPGPHARSEFFSVFFSSQFEPKAVPRLFTYLFIERIFSKIWFYGVEI